MQKSWKNGQLVGNCSIARLMQETDKDPVSQLVANDKATDGTRHVVL